jgi:hypothetical protein
MDEVYVSLLNIISQEVVPHLYMFGSGVNVTPQVFIRLFDANDWVNQVNHVDLGQTWLTWVITSKTKPTIPNDQILVNPWSKHGKNP